MSNKKNKIINRNSDKKYFILFIIIVFVIISVIFTHDNKIYKVTDVISPTEIVLDNKTINIKGLDCFDTEFTLKNKHLAKTLNISENEAYILGNLGKYWTLNILKGRHVYLKNNVNIIYLKFDYKEKFKYSGFCLDNGKPCYQEGFEKYIDNIRHTKFAVLDTENENIYEIDSPQVKYLKQYLVIKKIHLPRKNSPKKNLQKDLNIPYGIIDSDNIKIFFTDMTTNLKPDRNCKTSMCHEILNNINNSQETIDMAIYGYSRIYDIEKALINAIKRGVKIRLVYDSDTNGDNIYPDTNILTKIIPNNINDRNSGESNNIMHNKFYIFDNKVLITGSSNLSHTDMSGFNSNSMIVIKSDKIVKRYKMEFDEMFSGKFHNEKKFVKNTNLTDFDNNISAYFSPQDKTIDNALLPLINNAQKYIYIPIFALTDKKVTSALISAKQRGVDIKIIIDALNASIQHSKHKELRNGGILVKTENYAGKMHSKSMIIDDEYTVIGSMNFSYSGENKNDENMLVIKNQKITKAYKDFFLYQWNKIDNYWLKHNARAEGKDSIGSCSDGLDNNYNGLTDLADPACK